MPTTPSPRKGLRSLAARAEAARRLQEVGPTYDPAVAISICERIAEGETLAAICQSPGMPNRATFRRWVVRDETLRRAYEAARDVQAHSLFEEALDIARTLKTEKLDAAKVRAYDVAIATLKWAAGKLSPQYAERTVATPTLTIQINTPLNLGPQDRSLGPAPGDNLYTLKAAIELPSSPEASAPTGELDQAADPDGGPPPPSRANLSPARPRARAGDPAEGRPPPKVGITAARGPGACKAAREADARPLPCEGTE